MSERMIRDDGIEIATEAFGDPTDPPVLLIMGAGGSMLWWPDAFCERLAASGRYVIRYDNRDTGRSTTYPPGKPPYTLDDLANDAIRVMDDYGIRAAHVVGISMGGVIGQILALEHPDRVISLTAISTTPIGAEDLDLPPPTEAFLAVAAQGESVDWSDRDKAIDFMADFVRATAGTAHPHDAAGMRKLIERDVDRARNFASTTNHFVLKGGDQWTGRLHEMRAPLLVVHGTADPIFPIEHAIALSSAVAGARHRKIEGGGHELHEADFDGIVGAIAKHSVGRLGEQRAAETGQRRRS